MLSHLPRGSLWEQCRPETFSKVLKSEVVDVKKKAHSPIIRTNLKSNSGNLETKNPQAIPDLLVNGIKTHKGAMH